MIGPLVMLSDLPGGSISMRQLTGHLDAIDVFFTLAFGVLGSHNSSADLEEQRSSVDEDVRAVQKFYLKLYFENVRVEFSQTQSFSALTSIDLSSIEWPRLHVSSFNHELTRKVPGEFADKRLILARDSVFEVVSISYNSPLEIKVAVNSLRALVVAVIICGGEVDLNEGKIAMPGLVDAAERMIPLIAEVFRKSRNADFDAGIEEVLRSKKR